MKSPHPPALSVVIPTYDRSQRLARVLDALDHQRTTIGSGSCAEPFAFEVIVVADGCTDDTGEVVRRPGRSFDLRLIEQGNAGPAVARNRGVEAAGAEVVVFIDDDVVPEPGCLAAHLAHHRERPDLVVIGPMLTPEGVELSGWVAWEQHQLEKQYAVLAEGTPAHHRQFYTGNASVPTSALRATGGFDVSLRRAEDVELAQRLDGLGLSFVFEPDARAFHHAERSFESWREMAYVYGRNDVLFAQRGRPSDLDVIRRFYGERHASLRLAVRAVVPRPRVLAVVDAVLTAAARVVARTGPRRACRITLSALYNLRYYGGVADQLGGGEAFASFLRDGGAGDPGSADDVPGRHGADRETGADLEAGTGGRADDDLVAWFVLEQTLGHVTHGKNLVSLVPQIEGVTPVFLPVDDSLTARAGRVPGWSNWTVRAGVRAIAALRRASRDSRTPAPDAVFVHSQVPAVLLERWMRRHPTVVSLDATPLQYDELGEFYRHEVGNGALEGAKMAANRRCYARSAHLVTWSRWARRGLVEDYGVDEGSITVIAPGVDVDRWSRPPGRERTDGPLRVLFVGGDLHRKGGDLLLAAADRLRADDSVPDFEVHLVTPAEVEHGDGVVVHRGLTANDPALIERYWDADVFCLPTLGDCLPMVLAEAGAAGLPLISTDVGAIRELVVDDETGTLVPPGDLDALVGALGDLLRDGERRARLGAGALALVRRDHDARRNAGRIVDVLREAASSARPTR